MPRIAHVINPVNAPPGSELSIVQPITFESMRIARQFSQRPHDIELLSVSYPEDHPIVPEYFRKVRDLDRSIRDIDPYRSKKKLPYISDILHEMAAASDAEWLIYTNADIALMPQFYDAVSAFINEGNDAILITRRRISKIYKDAAQLPLMYSELGAYHPGYDCFVFHRSLLEQFVLDDICIGIPFIEISLMHNMVAFGKKLKHVDDMHLTFHIGMEVMPPVDRDLYLRNREIYEQKIRPFLGSSFDSRKFPYAHLPFAQRMMKYALNPCFSTALMLELEGKNIGRRLKIALDELRWRILSG